MNNRTARVERRPITYPVKCAVIVLCDSCLDPRCKVEIECAV
jgi:hypothetical protein